MAIIIAIIGLILALSGIALAKGNLTEFLSPRGERQLESLGIFLACCGGATILWLVSAFLALHFLKEPAIRSFQSRMERLPLSLLVPLVIAGTLFIMYYPALHHTYFADDFNLVEYFTGGPLRAVLPFAHTYHYNPVNVLLLGIPYWFGIGNPVTHRIINLTIHCINAGLVYRLGFVFTRSRFHAIGASILFSFFFLNYDPGLWPLGGFPYVMTTFLVLLSFLHLHNRPYELDQGLVDLAGAAALDRVVGTP